MSLHNDPSNRSSSSLPPVLPAKKNDVSHFAHSKIKEAHTPSFASLIGRKISWIGNKIDGWFGNWFSRCYARFFKNPNPHEYELEKLKDPYLEEIPIDECFSADEFKLVATKDGRSYINEKILIKGIYGYRLLEIEEIDGDDVIIKDFYEIKTHINQKDIWHFKHSDEITDPKLKIKVINLTQK